MLIKVKTSELEGSALDWAVAKCEGEEYSAVTTYTGIGQESPPTNYSTDWTQGGPIIEREGISVNRCGRAWTADISNPVDGYIEHTTDGTTPLIAAMRCYVASKLGDTVEIPKELNYAKQ